MSFELIPAMRIASSGLAAENARMTVAANNLANVNSTKDVTGKGPYQRRELVFQAVFQDALSNGSDGVKGLDGVKISSLERNDSAPINTYMPYHPAADKNGMVAMPNIQPVKEMVDMVSATRSYEANLSVIKQSKDMAKRMIDLLK